MPVEEAGRGRLVSSRRRSTAIPAPKHRPPVATLARSQRRREALPVGRSAAGQSVPEAAWPVAAWPVAAWASEAWASEAFAALRRP